MNVYLVQYLLLVLLVNAAVPKMTAVDKISALQVQPFNKESFIDIRHVKLSDQKEGADGEGVYNPRHFRSPKSPISTWMAYFNLIRSMLGPGLLIMPLNMSMAGVLAGSFIICGTGLLLIHTHSLLLDSLNEVSRQLKIPYISYRYGFRLALLHGPPVLRRLGNKGPTIVAAFMIMSQLGICTVTVVMTADSLRDILDWRNTKPALSVLLIPFLLLVLFAMKTLKWITYVSLLSTGLNLLGLILVFYFILDDPHGKTVLITPHSFKFLFVFGAALYNLSAVGVILLLDKNLRDPTAMVKNFSIIRVGIAIPTVIATVLGVSGYWAFGNMEENILRSLPFDDGIALICMGLYIMTMVLTYPLQCYPAVYVVKELLAHSTKTATPLSDDVLETIETLVRPMFVLATFLIAYMVPFQAPLVAFVGNLCTTILSLVFPALMDISLRYPSSYGYYRLILIKDIAIVLLGVITWITGVVFCANLIYVRFLYSQSIIKHDNLHYL